MHAKCIWNIWVEGFLSFDMQSSLHRTIIIVLITMIIILLIIIMIIVVLIMINCVMRALSSGLSEGWSRSPPPTRIAGTLPKMQLLQYFCTFPTF